ncbi:MAG: FAD-dependent oxidoreductase [Leptolyngbyaceae bacterium]|nr:FAD-dependent oxidoreductase [Leptolyngbyaceae bacterium]
MESQRVFDIAVIGAGVAGLICAQQLHQAGYRVVVVEKSRGLGGRMATRRLQGTCADHGVRYLEPKGELLQGLIAHLVRQGILRAWTDTVYQLQADFSLQKPGSADLYPRYAAPLGMSAIAKFLGANLEIWLNRRAEAIALTPHQTWQLDLAIVNPAIPGETPQQLEAKAVVVAIPAPQAVMLLEPLGTALPLSDFLADLRSVEFAPCISAIAGYAAARQPDLLHLNPGWRGIECPHDPDLAWISWDSSKRLQSPEPVFVVQSTAKFAETHLESQALESVGRDLLTRAAQVLPWLNAPDWLQVHRWRYAFPQRPWPQSYLNAATPIPLVCSGDWCGTGQIESALASGLTVAAQINGQLANRPLPDLLTQWGWGGN